jgi:hypothetical protein
MGIRFVGPKIPKKPRRISETWEILYLIPSGNMTVENQCLIDQLSINAPCSIAIWLVGKNMKVRWDDDIPNIWKVIKTMFQTTNEAMLVYQRVLNMDP